MTIFIDHFKVAVCLLSAALMLSACLQNVPPPAIAPKSPVIQRILQRGALIVGTAGSMPPLNMTAKDGSVIGIEPDLAGYIADAMGVRLRLVTMRFDELLPVLMQGKIDMVMSGMTITARRNLQVAFVGPYLVSGQTILTRFKTIAGAGDSAMLNKQGTRVAVLKGSTGQTFAEKVIPRASRVLVDSQEEGVLRLLQGEADALVADYPFCAVSVFRYPDQGLTTLGRPLTYEPIGIAIPADDPHLINWLDNFISTLRGSGEMQLLQKKWIEDGAWLRRLP